MKFKHGTAINKPKRKTVSAACFMAVMLSAVSYGATVSPDSIIHTAEDGKSGSFNRRIDEVYYASLIRANLLQTVICI
ncbi:MAG: hypothetical protein HFG52_15920 [Lachnospiraceae bacterium]|nr:hypothetical protein [Lachnospiraceae bacterium]